MRRRQHAATAAGCTAAAALCSCRCACIAEIKRARCSAVSVVSMVGLRAGPLISFRSSSGSSTDGRASTRNSKLELPTPISSPGESLASSTGSPRTHPRAVVTGEIPQEHAAVVELEHARVLA
ncbi:MAG TPA: hypothetical protein VF331_18750 [Polyangiales bacterium]